MKEEKEKKNENFVEQNRRQPYRAGDHEHLPRIHPYVLNAEYLSE